MSQIINTLRAALVAIIERIDEGKCRMSDEDAMKAIEVVGEWAKRDRWMSKYQACNYLGLSRSTFDERVRLGMLPKGRKIQGFKELVWTKEEIDKWIR